MIDSVSTSEMQPPSRVRAALIYVRSVLGTGFLLLYTLFVAVSVLFAGWLEIMPLVNFVMHIWGTGILWVFNVKVEELGRENVPENGGCVLLVNHQSDFDIFVLHALFKNKFRWGAKIELFKIPIFGQAMRKAGVLPIARNNRAEVFRVYKAAEKRFAEGFVYALAPEGTRQPEPVIGAFKRGPFIFAINAKAPIVPVVIKGAYEVLSKKNRIANLGRWKRTIHVEFLPAVSTENLTVENADEIMNRTRAAMVAAYARLPQESPQDLGG